MDRNNALGLVLMFALLFVYFQFFAPTDAPPSSEQAKQEQKAVENKNTTNATAATLPNDSAQLAKSAKVYGENLAKATLGETRSYTIENEELRLTFSNKGAELEKAVLKKYKQYAGGELVLFENGRSNVDVMLPLNSGNASLSDLFFTKVVQNNEGIVFSTESSPAITISYTFNKDNAFLVNQKIDAKAFSGLIAQPISLLISDELPNNEKDIANSRINATVNYFTPEDGYDNLTESALEEKKEVISSPLNWVSLKQRFFNIGLVPAKPFVSADLKSFTDAKKDSSVKNLEAKVLISAADFTSGSYELNWFLGPNKYKLLQTVTDGFEENVYLGIPVVNLINKFVVVNVFYFLEDIIHNYGIVIILLVVLIRSILLPLVYTSYLGMAKMRVLQPEINQIKEKFPDDTAKQQQEQMALYQKAGVNPLSGCIPLLLQLPVLLAMFNFLPNAIELRQEAFLWSEDLSTYDSIATLPFSLPGYGSHVSLFTILMTASTLLLTWYNNQTSTSLTGPMKYMSYIMPVIFMFILNSLPAGLNFYYLISNLVAFGQQVAIRNFVDDKAIHAKLLANKEKNKDKPQSSFQQRLQDAMKQAEEQKKAKKGTK